MNISTEITDIENQARKIGLTINQLCRLAGIDRSTFTKWKAGKSKPNWDTFYSVKNALESQLSDSQLQNGANHD